MYDSGWIQGVFYNNFKTHNKMSQILIYLCNNPLCMYCIGQWCCLGATINWCLEHYYRELKWHLLAGVINRHCQQFQKAVSTGSLIWSWHEPTVGGPTITERYSHSACYYDRALYIFGGCTSTATTFNDLWKFDLVEGRWFRPLATGMQSIAIKVHYSVDSFTRSRQVFWLWCSV